MLSEEVMLIQHYKNANGLADAKEIKNPLRREFTYRANVSISFREATATHLVSVLKPPAASWQRGDPPFNSQAGLQRNEFICER